MVALTPDGKIKISPVHHPPIKVRYPKRKRARIGVYLGTYEDSKTGIVHDLRADGVMPRGVLVMGPPGTGKSTCVYVPTLLTFEESAFVYDPKGELYDWTAGYRQRAMKQKILQFKPTDPKVSCRININDAIRWETIHEEDDVQNHVKLTLDPSDKAAEGAEAHWIACGSILLECTKMFLHYYDKKLCNLAGEYDFLTDPRWDDPGEGEEGAPMGIDACLEFMATTPLDPHLKHGWVDHDNNPTPFNPYIVHSALEVKRKPTNEKGGVVSTTTRFLQPFRTKKMRQLTCTSDFDFDDLMNYKRPVTLYFVIPPAEIQRLRVIVRLFLNLLVRAHTGDEALVYKNGQPHYRYKWRCLLAVDEFPQLGKQEQFMLSLAVMRSYGLWPMLGVQSPNQIYEAFGRYQAVTSMLYYKVFFRPNDPEAAEWISKYLGETTAPHISETESGPIIGFKTQKSVTTSYNKEPLMSPSSLLNMPEASSIILYGSEDVKRWTNPIWGGKLHYASRPELLRRSRFAPPEQSDVIRVPVNAQPPLSAEEQIALVRSVIAARPPADAAAANAEPSPAQAADAPSGGPTAADVIASAEAIVADAMTTNSISMPDEPDPADSDGTTRAAASIDDRDRPAALPGEPVERATDPPDEAMARKKQMDEFLQIADEPLSDDEAPPVHELPDGHTDPEEPMEEPGEF